MRKVGLLCVAFSAVMALLLVFPVLAEEPGDALLEVFEKDIQPAESLLPPGVTVAEGFQPGAGDPIGTVKSAKGRMLVVHRGENTAFALQKDNPVFSFDTLVTEEKTSAGIEFNDKSFITLGTYTKIVLDKSIYDPSKATRESFLRLLFGKARFIVTKLADFRSSQYKVKTPTAVVGVRGSDFAVAVAPGSPLMTTLATGKDTTVLFVGDTGPAQVIGPMQAATARAGGAASAGVGISGLPQALYSGLGPNYLTWGLGIGGAAVVGGILIGSDGSDSGSGPLTVQESPPTASTQIPPVASTFDVTFTFSKDINPVSISNNFLELSGQWTLSLISQNSRVVVIQAAAISVPTDLIIELVNIQGTDGSPLQPPTRFTYTVG